jgi:hypothetical protein
MANPTNKFVMALFGFAVLAGPAVAKDAYNQPYYNDASRSDFIALDAGDAGQHNIAVQTPTPWPSYINDTDIPMAGDAGALIYGEYLGRHAKQAQSPVTINLNLGGAAGGQ